MPFWTIWTFPHMKRSDIVTVALPGNLGKPRPALVIQSDLFDLTGSVVILPITSTITEITTFRTLLEPSDQTGLRVQSHVMIDKITHLSREKVGGVIGKVSKQTMTEIDQGLALFLGIA